MTNAPSNFRYVSAGAICEITATPGIVIEMFRSGKYVGQTEGLEGFRPAKVLKNGEEIWSFKTCGATAPRFGVLESHAGEHFIVIRDKRHLFSIVRVNDFAHSAPAMIKGKQVFIGGSSVEVLLDFKAAIAKHLDIDYMQTEAEDTIQKKRTAAAREALKLVAAAQEAEKAAARAKREEIRQEIESRNKVDAWSLTGKPYFGIPVTGDEWKSLPNGTYCILMQDGAPVEAFQVLKDKAHVKKGYVTEVTATKPVRKEVAAPRTVTAPEVDAVVTITIGGIEKNVMIFGDQSVLEYYQKRNLNSDTCIGILPKGKPLLDVYMFSGGGHKKVGTFTRKTIASQLEI